MAIYLCHGGVCESCIRCSWPPFGSALIWFALQCSKSKQCAEIHGYDHMPVSRGCMRAQYPFLMAPVVQVCGA